MAANINDVNLEIELTISSVTKKIKKGQNFRLVDISGITSPNNELSEQEYVGNGGYITNRRVSSREITLVIGIPERKNAESVRQDLINWLTNDNKVTMKIANTGQTRYIEGYITGIIETERQNWVYDHSRFNITIYCPNPFFTNGSLQSGSWSGGTVTFNNAGDRPCGFYFYGKSSGNIPVPTLTLDSGESIVITQALVTDDTLEISTVPGESYIKINGSTVYKFDPASDFFLMPPGSHTVALTGSMSSKQFKGTLLYNGV